MPAMGLAEARTEIPHWQCWLREEMAATRLVPGGDLDEGRAEGGGDFAVSNKCKPLFSCCASRVSSNQHGGRRPRVRFIQLSIAHVSMI
ncbi:uncharacterized protein A4U43_C04F2410 [Asparagus officinalis]|uniref:Uncharacterized protein n=1 Tax=Asparagus officinalis TaxID=4686 RepID=A0A5P1EZG8_ASPOF|nr:uncharacterized protein A4U43_C04F2410 [Asparagus officinalis]